MAFLDVDENIDCYYNPDLKDTEFTLKVKVMCVKKSVKNEDEFKEVQRQTLSKIFKDNTDKQEDVSLSSLGGIGSKTIQRLEAAGMHNLKDIKKAGLEQLESIEGIGKKTAEKLLHMAEENTDTEIQESEVEREAVDKKDDASGVEENN